MKRKLLYQPTFRPYCHIFSVYFFDETASHETNEYQLVDQKNEVNLRARDTRFGGRCRLLEK